MKFFSHPSKFLVLAISSAALLMACNKHSARRVYFGNLTDAQAIESPFTVEMKAENLVVEPAVTGVTDGHGHFHIIVDAPMQDAPAPIAKDVSQRTQAFSGRLPFEGAWYVAAEHGYLDPHKRFLAEAFAYDFLQIGPNGKSYQRDGKNNADYYAYGKKVLAAKDGTVVAVRGDMAENVPGETTNVQTPSGNVVIIDHGNNQFGYYAHLKPFTVAVKPGAKVKAGDILGEVGNSGDSDEPHLHFHVMNHADPAMGDGIPAVFESWKSQSYSRLPIARQLGILPRGEFVQP